MLLQKCQGKIDPCGHEATTVTSCCTVPFHSYTPREVMVKCLELARSQPVHRVPPSVSGVRSGVEMQDENLHKAVRPPSRLDRCESTCSPWRGTWRCCT